MTQAPIDWPELADLHAYFPVTNADCVLVQITPDTHALFRRLATLGLDSSDALPCANGNILIGLDMDNFLQVYLRSIDGESPNDTINRLCREYLGDRPH